MSIFKTLVASIISVLSLVNPIISETISPIPSPSPTPFPIPILPIISSSSDLPISPDFALQLIQSNLNLIQITFDNPENSFNVITDPQQRLTFLQDISSSTEDLISSLSFVNQVIPFGTDISFISILNNQLSQINDEISQRVSQFLLPLNVSQVEINPTFIISRFNQTEINTFYQQAENIFIQIPSIIQPLNQSLFDLSVQIENYINTIPSEDIMASINSIQLKLGDINGFSFPSKAEIIFTINQGICDFTPNCDLYCGVSVPFPFSGWNKIPAQIYNLHQIRCEVDLNLQGKDLSILSTSQFYTVAVFQGDISNGGGDKLSTPFIVFISFVCLLFVVMIGYAIRKFIHQKKTGLLNNPSKQANGYQSVV